LDALNGSSDDPEAQHALLADLIRGAASTGEAEVLRLMENYEQGLAEMAQGPLRPATYLGPADCDLPAPQPRLHVVTADGQERYPTPHQRIRPAELRVGQTVYLDAKGGVALAASSALPRSGQEGTFLRALDGIDLVETTLQNDRLVVRAAEAV